jgi:hypothetical protein
MLQETQANKYDSNHDDMRLAARHAIARCKPGIALRENLMLGSMRVEDVGTEI